MSPSGFIRHFMRPSSFVILQLEAFQRLRARWESQDIYQGRSMNRWTHEFSFRGIRNFAWVSCNLHRDWWQHLPIDNHSPRTRTHTNKHAWTDTHTHTHMSSHSTEEHTHRGTHIRMHTHTHTHTSSHSTEEHTLTQTHTHTHTHTHKQEHTHLWVTVRCL